MEALQISHFTKNLDDCIFTCIAYPMAETEPTL